jgi:hypothetical protein
MKGRQAAIWLALWLPASVGVHAAAFLWALHRSAEVARFDELPERPAVLAGGETFDIDQQGSPASESDESSATQNEVNPAPGDGSETRVKARNHKSPTKKADSQGENTEGATLSALFGAAGDRSAVDLATAFTRTFPQTASADPIWASAPMGSAGSVDAILQIDDSGTLVRAELGSGGSDALRRDVERTLSLLRHRVFTATQMTTTLTIRARISADAVHDDVHGNVFAVGGSFAANEGSAFFSLAIGKRIDVRVTTH